MSANRMKRDILTGLVVASVVGAAIGAGVALLFAPRSGGTSRDLITRRTRELKHRIAAGAAQGKAAVKNGVIRA